MQSTDHGVDMNDRKVFLGLVLVAITVVTSAIPLGRPPDKEPPPPGVTANRYVGHQHNQVLL